MTTKMISHLPLFRRLSSRRGQSLVEYALVISFISVLSVAVLSVLGPQIRGLFSMILTAVSAAYGGF